VLAAKGQPEIPCKLSMSYVTDPNANVRDMEVTIASEDFGRMAGGVAYALRPRNAGTEYRWEVKQGLTLIREPRAEELMKAILERLDRLEKRIEALEKKK
jgi:hypothetical protein